MYYLLWSQLLDLIAERFKNCAGLTNDDFYKRSEGDWWKKDYYLNDHRINLNSKGRTDIPVEFKHDDFKFIGSRKAMNYNLFGEGTVIIKENEYGIGSGIYSIDYNKKIPLINNKNTFVQLDTQLISKNEFNIIRTQFMEWLVLKNKSIKEPFLHSEFYFSKQAANLFIQPINSLLSTYGVDGDDYFGIFYNLDSLNIIKELLAAYNIVEQNKHTALKRINIIECYWKPHFYEKLRKYSVKVYIKERKRQEELVQMKEIISPIIRGFKEQFDIDVGIYLIDLWEMLSILDKSKEEITWMSRYVV